MNGFESDIAAAFASQHVPLEIVAERAQADIIASGKAEMEFQPRTDVFRAASPAAHASLTLRAAGDASIVFYGFSNKKYATHGQRDNAEAIAKQLRTAIRRASSKP